LIAALSVSIGGIGLLAHRRWAADRAGRVVASGATRSRAWGSCARRRCATRIRAFVYGLLYGPLTLPCSGALVVSIFALSLSTGQALVQFAAFVAFGLGFGLPLLALSLLSGAAQRAITRTLAQHALWVNRIAGVLLVGVGVYDIVLNWELLKSFWA
jgi:cytochrome c biogenesis protein CcdA